MLTTTKSENLSVSAFNAYEPPLEVAVDCVRSVIKDNPVRIAFVGRAGAGKTTTASIIARDDYPLINNADFLKEEVLEWLSSAHNAGFDPESDESFIHFADFMGLSVSRIQDDMWDLIGPVFGAFTSLYLKSVRDNLDVLRFNQMHLHTNIPEKVAFVDLHKNLFRQSLQLYGQMSKEIAADEEYWVQHTLNRSLAYPICFNCDTRFTSEMECLRNCGWTGIYLSIDDETQHKRRPQMTEDERNHISEWSISPSDCDYVIDSTKSLSSVLMNIADYLSNPKSKKKREMKGYIS